MPQPANLAWPISHPPSGNRARRLAGLAVRRAGHAPLYADCGAVCGAAAGRVADRDRSVGFYSSWIQAAFMVGWALGGGLFGRMGDRIGRSRALVLTILTYAIFTGAGFLAQTWWHLLDLPLPGGAGHWRRMGGRGGAAWRRPGPRAGAIGWRPCCRRASISASCWPASSAYAMAGLPHRYVFLAGPGAGADRALDSPGRAGNGRLARGQGRGRRRGAAELPTCFAAAVLRTTLLTMAVCALSLTAHWAFVFWQAQHLRQLPEVVALSRRSARRRSSARRGWC